MPGTGPYRTYPTSRTYRTSRLILRLLEQRIAWTVLGIALAVTALTWQLCHQYLQRQAEERFALRTEELRSLVEGRLSDYVQVLRGGRAMFDAGSEPTREQWRNYVASLELERHYPGAQGLGYAKLVRASELAAHLATQRAETDPDYQLSPAGERETYGLVLRFAAGRVVRHAEKLHSSGFDLLTEPGAQAAMSRARDHGEPAMSTLTPNTTLPDGVLIMFAPVYQAGMPTRDVAERDAALLGWVYSPFGANELMHGLLHHLPPQLSEIEFSIYDGETIADTRLLYRHGGTGSSGGTADQRLPDRALQRELTLASAGQVWTLAYQGRGLLTGNEALTSFAVALGGLLIDLLIFLTIAAIVAQKREVELEVRLRTSELAERNGHLLAMFALSPDGFVILRRAGGSQAATSGSPGSPDSRGSAAESDAAQVEYLNPAFERLTGLAAEPWLGMSQSALESALAERCLHDALAANDSERLYLRTPEHRILLRGERENESHRFLYYRDITREVEVERMKSEFLSTAAHELRTPMVSIFGFTELMLSRRYDEGRQKQMLQTIHRQTRRLVDMVNELLDLARIEGRRGKDFCPAPHSAFALLDGVRSSLPPDSAERLQLLCTSADDLPIEVDAAKTQQALLNVISNAIKFSGAAMPVALELIRSEAQAGRLGLRVRDRGIGMTNAQLARACERFYRADPSGSVPGTGLGLSLVKEIVELQGGKLELQSEAGVGTAITLWLPLSRAAEPVPHQRGRAAW